jgi:hypothetical protein
MFHVLQRARALTQVRMHLLSSMGRVKSKNIGVHAASAHKLAVHPTQVHCFYSSGEDGVVRHYDIRQKRAGSQALLSVFSAVPSRVRTPLAAGSINDIVTCGACVSAYQ